MASGHPKRKAVPPHDTDDTHQYPDEKKAKLAAPEMHALRSLCELKTPPAPPPPPSSSAATTIATMTTLDSIEFAAFEGALEKAETTALHLLCNWASVRTLAYQFRSIVHVHLANVMYIRPVFTGSQPSLIGGAPDEWQQLIGRIRATEISLAPFTDTSGVIWEAKLACQNLLSAAEALQRYVGSSSGGGAKSSSRMVVPVCPRRKRNLKLELEVPAMGTGVDAAVSIVKIKYNNGPLLNNVTDQRSDDTVWIQVSSPMVYIIRSSTNTKRHVRINFKESDLFQEWENGVLWSRLSVFRRYLEKMIAGKPTSKRAQGYQNRATALHNALLKWDLY